MHFLCIVAPISRIGCSKSRSGGAPRRGADQKQEAMFSYISPEKRVPSEHPWRPIREMVNRVLKEMSPRWARLYAKVGRPSISARASAARPAAANLLFHPQRATADRSDGRSLLPAGAG